LIAARIQVRRRAYSSSPSSERGDLGRWPDDDRRARAAAPLCCDGENHAPLPAGRWLVLGSEMRESDLDAPRATHGDDHATVGDVGAVLTTNRRRPGPRGRLQRSRSAAGSAVAAIATPATSRNSPDSPGTRRAARARPTAQPPSSRIKSASAAELAQQVGAAELAHQPSDVGDMPPSSAAAPPAAETPETSGATLVTPRSASTA